MQQNPYIDQNGVPYSSYTNNKKVNPVPFIICGILVFAIALSSIIIVPAVIRQQKAEKEMQQQQEEFNEFLEEYMSTYYQETE